MEGVPATLALSLGQPAAFGPFTPGVAKDYTASTTANVISTAGDATLSVADPSTTATGHLVNGAFFLPETPRPIQEWVRGLMLGHSLQALIACTRSMAGTDFRATFDHSLAWVKTSGIINPRYWSNLPAGEVFTTPASVDGTRRSRISAPRVGGGPRAVRVARGRP